MTRLLLDPFFHKFTSKTNTKITLQHNDHLSRLNVHQPIPESSRYFSTWKTNEIHPSITEHTTKQLSKWINLFEQIHIAKSRRRPCLTVKESGSHFSTWKTNKLQWRNNLNRSWTNQPFRNPFPINSKWKPTNDNLLRHGGHQSRLQKQ